MALLVGAPAPDFALAGWYNRAEGQFRLSAERGHPVVLAFYPGDERLICTRQLCSYSDDLADLHQFDAVVWGVNTADLESHRRFADGRKLRMPLLCDLDGDVSRAYGVLGPLGVRRCVFVIDPEGRIAWRRVAALGVTFPSAEDIRRALDDLGRAA